MSWYFVLYTAGILIALVLIDKRLSKIEDIIIARFSNEK